jgi:NAD(P)-dependent dehydrogenase (short-subunit alcohol dehydrogenase family)
MTAIEGKNATGRFTGKIAVVTGGANGIGRASAKRLSAEGATVVILDLETNTARDAASEIESMTGSRVVSYGLDLTDLSAIQKVFAAIRAEVGEIDILLNNVGQTARENATEFWNSKPETWDFVIGVSLMSTLRVTHQVAATMRERGSGKIVCIASDSAVIGDAGIADYAAAKSGVMGFVRSLARELAPFKVNVNAICPGLTLTRGPKKLSAEFYAKSLAGIPMGEPCEPDDIAASVAFLASEDARFITGQALFVNGGRTFY